MQMHKQSNAQAHNLVVVVSLSFCLAVGLGVGWAWALVVICLGEVQTFDLTADSVAVAMIAAAVSCRWGFSTFVCAF